MNETTATVTPPKAVFLDPARIRAWEKNPRKRFRPAAMDALRESVRADGVIQPILVRPDPSEDGFFLVVGGERRWRVCCDLKVEVPAMVREMTEGKAQELACFENLTREDLDPEEEASAIEGLLQLMTWDDVIKKTGRSRAHIHRLQKLLQAPAELLDAVAEGQVSYKVASVVGELKGAELRKAAAQRVLTQPELTVAGSIQMVQKEFSLRLKSAAFDPTDATLDPGRGACGGCEFNSANAGDVWSSHACCLNQGCFRAKEGVHRHRVLEVAAESGVVVMSDAEAEEARSWESPLVALEDEIPVGDMKPLAAAKRKRWFWKLLAYDKAGEVLVELHGHLPAGARDLVYYADRRQLEASAKNLLALDLFRTRAVSSRAAGAQLSKGAKAQDEMELHEVLNTVSRSVATDGSGRTLRGCRHALFSALVGAADPWMLGFFTVRLGLDPMEVTSDEARAGALTERYSAEMGRPLVQDALFHELLAVVLASFSEGALAKSDVVKSLGEASRANAGKL